MYLLEKNITLVLFKVSALCTIARATEVASQAISHYSNLIFLRTDEDESILPSSTVIDCHKSHGISVCP